VPALGLVKGGRWGTLTVRAAGSFSAGEGKLAFGEYAVEYLKRTSERWRWVVAIEGEEDERALIVEAQLEARPGLMIKLNNGFGLTSKAPDVAPEVGAVFSFGP